MLDASNWTANTDTATQDVYPYVYVISTSIYNNASRPVWQIDGTASTGIPTATELEAIAFIQDAYFSTSGVTVYATDEPTVNVVFVAKGA